MLDQPGLTLEALATGQRFAIRRGADVAPTVAGCLLFGSHPEWLQPTWRITALRFSGTEITAPIVDRLDTEDRRCVPSSRPRLSCDGTYVWRAYCWYIAVPILKSKMCPNIR